MIKRHLGAKEANPAVAFVDDSPRHHTPSPAMGNAHQSINGLPVHIHDLHNGATGIAQHCTCRIRVLKARHNHTRRPPGEHLIENLFLFLWRVLRDPDDRLQRCFVQNTVDARQNFGKYHVGERWDDDSYKIYPLRSESPGNLVRHVSQALGRRQNLLAGRFADIPAVAQNPTDGHFTDTRRLGNVA